MSELTDFLEYKANLLRLHSLEMTTKAGSGHPTSCLSAAEIMSTLFYQVMRYDPRHLDSFDNDEFVLSKGHAAPILYAAFAEAGAIPKDQLMQLREFDSPLEGHPVPRIAGVRAATGSLGQGLSIGVGLALAIKLDRLDRRVYVLLGDGEMAEGNVWEAINLAPHLGLDNLVAIVDMNRLGQSDPTLYGWSAGTYASRAKAFGWQTFEVDGHSVNGLLDAFEQAKNAGRPVMIVARTVKGKGVPFLADKEGWHGNPVPPDRLEEALSAVRSALKPVERSPENFIEARERPRKERRAYRVQTEYRKGDKEASRTAFGRALEQLGGQDRDIVVLDGDVKNSTRTQFFFGRFPERSVECFIDEQNMVAISVGLAARGKRPVAATFAAFLTRAFDQLRMAAYSRARITLSGSHTGVSIGQDGPSQMGLEDIAMMRSLFGSAVLCPADATAAAKLTAAAVAYDGVAYVRTARPKTEIVYGDGEEFRLGEAKILRFSGQDAATVVAAGVTVPEALHAAEELEKEGIHVRVVDCYSIKPIPRETLQAAAQATGIVFTVEDHYAEGGLGEAVAGAVAGLAPVHQLAVKRLPHSGAPDKLLAEQGIDREGIVRAVRDTLAARRSA